MSKPLFDNVGCDMKEYASGLYTTSMAGYILIALVVGVASCALMSEIPVLGILGIIIAIAVAVIGHYKAKLSVMKLYAYGELVDRVMKIEGRVSNSKSDKPSPKPGPMPHPVGPSDDLPVNERNADGTWDCIFCDTNNPSNVKKCIKCGTFARFK